MASRKQHFSFHQRSIVVDLKNQGRSSDQKRNWNPFYHSVLVKKHHLIGTVVWLVEDPNARLPVQLIAISSLM